MIFSFSSTGRLNGELYSIFSSSIYKIPWNPLSTIAYKDYTDQVCNFFRIGSVYALWITLWPDGLNIYRS